MDLGAGGLDVVHTPGHVSLLWKADRNVLIAGDAVVNIPRLSYALHYEDFETVKDAHQADLATQDKYGVDYKQYWFNEDQGAVYCLVEAPNAEAAAAVHKEAHGLVADDIVEVSEGH